MDIPETRYAKTADGVHIAYQTVGTGPVDIVFVMAWTTHIELMWKEPTLARFLSRLAAFSRLILFDKRGTGLSDRVPDDRLPSLEVRMDDARAVMDAVGSERAIVMGFSEGGPMATLFAATYPERTIALVLFGTSACWRPTIDYPFPVPTDEQHERYVEEIERMWGTREFAAQELRDWAAPTLANDDYTIGWLADYLRHAASPGAAIALERMNRGIDIRPALPAIHVPTLVLARDGDLLFTAEETKWMADQIHGARFVSFPGVDHFFWAGNQDELLVEIERFVAEVGDEETDLDRVLATVMFTDIVGSTAKAAELGDRGWGDLVDRHHGDRPSAPRPVPRDRGRHGWRWVLRHVRRPRARRPVRTGDRRRGARPRARDPGGRAHGRGRDDRRRRVGGIAVSDRREGRGARRPRPRSWSLKR